MDFCVYSRHVENDENYPHSSLAGWFSIDKRTAALINPVLNDKPISIPQVAEEQAALRLAHCLK